MNATLVLSRAQMILVATVVLMLAAIAAVTASTAISAAGHDGSQVTQAKTKEWRVSENVVLAATKEWKSTLPAK
jgi:hypothetical protein